jgi:predicted nucleic acid-binding Zn ribbon protein
VPTYEYECPSCGKGFEQHFLDAKDRDRLAPLCMKSGDHINQRPMRTIRTPSAVSLHFKGDGWTPKYHE